MLVTLSFHGGSGLDIPQNLMAWSVMSVLALWCLLTSPVRRVTITVGPLLLITGVLLWSLPLLWSPHHDWVVNATPRVLALWAIVGLWMLLLHAKLGLRVRLAWLNIIILASLVQAVLAIIQFSSHHALPGGRPGGSFFQANVLASFLATGLVSAMLKSLYPSHQMSRVLAHISLVVLPAVLVLVQSRAGFIGALLGLLLILLCGYRKVKSIRTPILLMLSGVITGGLWLYGGHAWFPGVVPAPVSKSGSVGTRLYMLELTMRLIMRHPFAGNGYGGFEALFGQLAQITPPGLETDTVTHPHNELLYAWIEGGVIALMGVFLIAAGILMRFREKGGGLTGLALLIPIVTHMNLEYPLYISVSHSLLLLILLIIGEADLTCIVHMEHYQPFSLPPTTRLTIIRRIMVGLFAIGVVIFMITGLHSQQQLMKIEDRGLSDLVTHESETLSALYNKAAIYERLDFDKHIAMLLRFNLTSDPLLIADFRKWGMQYLNTHNDPGVYDSLLKIDKVQFPHEGELLCRQAHGRWSSDSRFICSPQIK